jgi:DNA-binding NarL/FixJ family response regulator
MERTVGKLRILLADDHKMIREGLQGLVNGQPDMEVAGEADPCGGRDVARCFSRTSW